MSSWRECKLGEIALKIGSGATPRGGGDSYKESGISLIRSQNILDFKFSMNGLAYIDDEQADGLKNVTVEENDILLNITGDSVARCCIVPNKILPARVNQHVSIIRPDSSKADYRFIFYNLQLIKEELLQQSEIGATRNALTKWMIENLDIYLPPLEEQKAIAEVLSSLDDKIDLLHRQNKTLEELAQTLFRQWFIEEAGDDWEEGCIGDIAILKSGKSRPKEESIINEIPIYGGNGILGYTNHYNAENESIIIGRVGAYCGSLYLENQPIWVSDNALLAKPTEEIYSKYLFYVLKISELNSMAEGSSHPLLTQGLIKSIPIVLPPKEQLISFNIQVNSWNKKSNLNKRQIQTLENLRDTLLPKLLSGEVRVKG
jgi:type I restriction enzyme S subunit